MPEPWTIARVLDWTRKDFAQRGFDSPRLEAELLLAHGLGLDRVALYTRFDQPLLDPELAAVRALVERRRKREPIAYILGRREFYGRMFLVDPRVLIPRPETEGVIEAVLSLLPPVAEGVRPRVLDVGSGSGAIAITLAAERPDLDVVSVDVSVGALAVASENATRLGVSERVTFRRGSVYEPLRDQRFALIVSNPPYLRTEEIPKLMRDVVAFEPHLALDGGAGGDAVLAPLVAGARAHLEEGGSLVVELSHDQAERARELSLAAGFTDVTVRKDLSGIERVLLAR